MRCNAFISITIGVIKERGKLHAIFSQWLRIAIDGMLVATAVI